MESPESLPEPLRQPAVPAGLSFGDGFQFGCGFFVAGIIAAIILILVLGLILLGLSLTGFSLLNNLLG